MALTKDQKAAQVKDLTKKMSEAQSVMFAHYIGLSVAEVSELRSKLREADAEMKVAKKTLIKLAAKEAGLPDIADGDMEGPVSLLLSFADPLSGAQIAFKFAKTHKQVALVGGVFDGKILSEAEAKELAKMPSREVLLATFVGMIQSPMRTFAGMCSSPLTGFARAMSELADKGGVNPETEAAAPAPAAEEAPKEEAETPKEEVTEKATTKDGEDQKDGEDSSQSSKSSDSAPESESQAESNEEPKADTAPPTEAN